MHKNGITTKRDSVYLTPVEEEGGLNHKTETLFGNAFFGQDSYEYYPSPHSQNGSSHSSGGNEQEEAEQGFEKRGVGLDFAILDSTFLLSQVFPTLFMGTIVQFAQSVTAYIASSAIFGAIAIYLASRIIFDQKDLKSWDLDAKNVGVINNQSFRFLGWNSTMHYCFLNALRSYRVFSLLVKVQFLC